MNMEQEEIVIATDNCEKALYIVAKGAMNVDSIKLKYVNRYAPTIEYILRMLRKSFGWVEVERGEMSVKNTRCKESEGGVCCMKKIKCGEEVRTRCKEYKMKYQNTFKVNTVVIEKAGPIRGM